MRTISTEVEESPLDSIIDSITHDMSRKAFRTRLRMLARISPANAAVICDHILAEKTERNIKASTAESKVKTLIWLTRYLKHKPFEQMTKQDILSYLNSIRKSTVEDPQQRWVGSYNGRLRVYIKFFKWLYNKDEPDHRKRTSPPCIQGLRQLPRQDGSSYKPADLWDNREHAVFLKYCPNARDRCYHAMANDMSARPHELLNLKIKDIMFKTTEDGVQYAQVLIRGGKTKPRTLPMIDSVPHVKEWILQHPTGTNSESWLFVSVAHANFGEKLDRDSLLAKYQYRYKASYFPKLLTQETVPEPDKAIIRNMLTKPWNLYVFRHSALTEKSQILTESTLRDHAGWTMTSKMPAVYLHYFGTESARKLLEAKGVIKLGEKNFGVLKSKQCPNCSEPNKPDSKFCAKCRMVLTYEAHQEKVNEIRTLQVSVKRLEEKMDIFDAMHEKFDRMGRVAPESSYKAKVRWKEEIERRRQEEMQYFLNETSEQIEEREASEQELMEASLKGRQTLDQLMQRKYNIFPNDRKKFWRKLNQDLGLPEDDGLPEKDQ